jgi:hypothetical protein
MTLEAKNLDIPDEKRSFEHGTMHVVNVAGATIGRTGPEAPTTRNPADRDIGADADAAAVRVLALLRPVGGPVRRGGEGEAARARRTAGPVPG